MPLSPVHRWSQTAAQVLLHVELPNVSARKPDVLITRAMVKVVAPPYLLLLDLTADVAPARSTVTERGASIEIAVAKVRPFEPVRHAAHEVTLRP